MHFLLIPGLMNDGWVWRHQIASLSRRGPVTVACNDGCATLGEMAERALAATTGDLCVIGHSMGGRIALEIVASAPDRVKRLALLDTGAGPRSATEAAGRLELVEIARTRGMAAVTQHWLPPMLGDAARANAGLVAGISAMLQRCDPEHFALQQQALLSRPDRRPLLPSIACPTLLATGSEDKWASPAQHAEMAAAIPQARLELVSGAGHMLPIEAPEALSKLLAAFLDGKVAHSGG